MTKKEHVAALLLKPENKTTSLKQIAKEAGVNDSYVASVRRELVFEKKLDIKIRAVGPTRR